MDAQALENLKKGGKGGKGGKKGAKKGGKKKGGFNKAQLAKMPVNF